MNPIEKEIAKLDSQWERFMASDKPVMRWVFKEDALQLARGFVLNKQQQPETTDDILIGLNSAFVQAREYGYTLTEEWQNLIVEGIAAANNEESGDGSKSLAEWAVINFRQYPHGFNALFSMASTFIERYAAVYESVVLAIMPPQVSNLEQYILWWDKCCDIARTSELWPTKLKLLVFDSVAHPLLGELTERYPEDVFTEVADTDMKSALQAIVDEADNGTPGAVLRKHILAMNYAIGEQQIAALEVEAEQAINLCVEHNYIDMLTTTLMMRAAGYLNAKQFNASIKDYREAQKQAQLGMDQQLPGCDKLQLQAVICEGTAHFSKNDYPEAAFTYQRAAPLAEALNDRLMILEAWRMTAFSFERGKEKAKAWQAGLKAMEAGKAMTEDERQASTLAYVGEGLIRVAPDLQAEQQVNSAFIDLLGDDWQSRNQAEAATC